MKKILLIIIITFPIFTIAQQPKMNLKLIGGINTNSFVYQIEGVDADVFTGWQLGGGVRVFKRNAFVEFDGLFKEYGASVIPFQDIDPTSTDALELRMKALEFPITAGYIPVKTPFFKLFVYGGLVNRFSLKGKIKYLDQEEIFKPKELDLHFYNLLAKFGSQFDLAMFNFDFNYSIGITNAIKNKARTNTHSLEFNVALLF